LYCRILSKVIKEAKRMECDRHILNSNNIMRSSWKLINKELGKDHKNHGIQTVNVNGKSTSIIKLLPMPLRSILHPSPYCTTTKEIENIIMSFKSSQSSGYDKVPTKLLKLCSHFISSPLNYICNRILFTGVFPDRLKYAIIRPIFKKGNINDISNYRQISTYPHFQKRLKKECKLDC
jgi:hypothetical protein